MTKVVLVLGESSLKKNLELALQHKDIADLFEVRADFLEANERLYLADFADQLPKPAILTFRLPKDGGVWEESEDLREKAFLNALEGLWYAIDLEEEIAFSKVIEKAKSRGTSIVRSFHDFTSIPKDTGERMQAIHDQGFIPKAAVMCKSTKDFYHWVNIAQQIQGFKEKVFLGMGEFGLPSRLLAGRWNMSWTYGSPEGQTIAPGQISAKEMSQIYQVPQIQPSTTVYGIIGNPVYHSKSPHFHNPGLRELKLDAVYLPLLVDKTEDFWPLVDLLGIKGLSVTIPWKEEAAKWAEGQSPRVQAIGASNTLYPSANKWIAENTDAPGFYTPIKERFGSAGLQGKKVTIIGNGGAAKAAIHAFLVAKAEVLVLGRNLPKVQSIIEGLRKEKDKVTAAELNTDSNDLIQAHSDIIVQTTPLGMGKYEGVNPLGFYPFQGTELLYEMVYVPEETAFIKAGQKAGCPWISGKSMLYYQGFLQFELFTGKRFPESLKSQFLGK